MEIINGNSNGEKRFAVINTTKYNDDGNWSIIVCNSNEELESLGFDVDEIKDINDLQIGSRWSSSIYGLDAQVVRIG